MQRKPDFDKWQAVLTDPAAPIDLQNEARRHLGLEITSGDVYANEYGPELDALVESLWGTRRTEGEIVHPLVDSVCHAIAVLLLLGGIESKASEHARLLLSVFPRCRSGWMQEHVRDALRVLQKHYANVLDSESLTKLEIIRSKHEETKETGIPEAEG